MITVWAFVFSICLGGTCDDYVGETFDNPVDCLTYAAKYAVDLDTDKQYALSCEQTHLINPLAE